MLLLSSTNLKSAVIPTGVEIIRVLHSSREIEAILENDNQEGR
jgi:plasmid stabilization system protein ParE